MLQPVVGNWYKCLGERETFEVVATDENSQTIEIQYFEGEVSELDLNIWYEMDIAEVPPPEDWSGPFDDLEKDDIETDRSASCVDWSDPLSHLDR